MTINLAQFTPLSSFGGGLLIGLAAIGLILLCGPHCRYQRHSWRMLKSNTRKSPGVSRF